VVYKLAHRADKANFSSICLMRASAGKADRAHNLEVMTPDTTYVSCYYDDGRPRHVGKFGDGAKVYKKCYLSG